MRLWQILALVAGLLLPFVSPFELNSWVWPAGIACTSVAAVLCHWRHWQQTSALAVAALLLSCGGWVGGSQLNLALSGLRQCAAIPADSELTAIFLGLPQQSNGRWMMRARTRFGDIRVRGAAQSPPISGEVWQIRLQMRPVSASRAAWMMRSGLCGQGRLLVLQTASDAQMQQQRQRQRWSVRTHLQAALGRIRQTMAERLRQSIGTQPPAAAVAAVVLGDTTHVPRQMWDSLRQTGTIHLLVISGLHLGLVALIGGVLLGGAIRLTAWGLLLRPLRDWRWLGSLLAAGLYAAMAGYGISAQRALLMLSLAAILFVGRRRPPSGPRILALLLAGLLLLNPLSALAPGLWLSFAGVATLWCCTATHQNLTGLSTSKPGRWWGLLKIFVHAQLAIACGLQIPLLLSGGVPAALSIPANLLAVPLIAMLAVPLGLTGTALLAVDALHWPANLLLTLSSNLMEAVLIWLDWLGSWSGSWGSRIGPARPGSHPLVLACALAACVFLLPPGFPGRRLWPVFFAAALLIRPSSAPVLEIDQAGEFLSGRIRAGHLLLHFRSNWKGVRFATGEAPLAVDYGCPALHYQVYQTAAALQVRSLATGTAGCALEILSSGRRWLIAGPAGGASEQALLQSRQQQSQPSSQPESGNNPPLLLFSPAAVDRKGRLRPHSYPLLALLRPQIVYTGRMPPAAVLSDQALPWQRYRWFDVPLRPITSPLRCSLMPPWDCDSSSWAWWRHQLQQ